MLDTITGYEPNGTFTGYHIRDYQSYVHVDFTVPPSARGNSPWTMVFDEEPRFGGRGMAPSPLHTAMAGFAT